MTSVVTLCFHLGVSTNGALALCAGVGAELIEALGAHVLLVLLHIFLPMQVVTAVVAVEAISHGGGEITPGTCGNTSDCQSVALQSSYPPPDGDSVAFSNIPTILWTMKVKARRFHYTVQLFKGSLQLREGKKRQKK